MYASFFRYPLMSNLVMKYTSSFIEVCVTAYFNGVTRSIFDLSGFMEKKLVWFYVMVILRHVISIPSVWNTIAHT